MLSDSVTALDANMVPFWADVPVTAWLQSRSLGRVARLATFVAPRAAVASQGDDFGLAG